MSRPFFLSKITNLNLKENHERNTALDSNPRLYPGHHHVDSDRAGRNEHVPAGGFRFLFHEVLCPDNRSGFAVLQTNHTQLSASTSGAAFRRLVFLHD